MTNNEILLVLHKNGAIISYNSELGFQEIQRMDDISEFPDHEPQVQLMGDSDAKAIASKLGFKFDDPEHPNKITESPFKYFCIVREDLQKDGLSVPIGDNEHYGGADQLEYRWKGGGLDIIEVFHNGEWKEANSIDFDFLN